jgi:hypothetical protein
MGEYVDAVSIELLLSNRKGFFIFVSTVNYKMNAFKFLVAYTFCFSTLNSFAQEQDSSKLSLRWVNLGGGISLLSRNKIDDTGVNGSVSYNHCLCYLYYQVGLEGTSVVLGPTALANAHIDIGKAYNGIHGLFAAFIGPSYIWGETDYQKTFHTIGLNANIQMIVKPAYFIGLGIEAYGNICANESEVGLRLILHLPLIHEKHYRKY